jgi:hypothetical protein
VTVILIGAVVWVAASFLLGIVVGKWIAGPESVDECPCGSCALAREVGE